MATWEHSRAVHPVLWRGSLTLVLGADPETFTLPGDEVCTDLATWLVDPVITVVEGGGPWDHYELERTIIDAHGGERVLLVRARPMFGATGTITGCVGVVADITADRDTEQALQEQTDRYRLLLELSPDGIVVHENGLIRWANKAAADFVGVPDLNDYLGESLTQFIHPDSLMETLERIASLKEDEAATKPAEATLVRLDGSTIVVESLSVRTKWGGNPAYQVIMRDLSLRRKAEETLRYQAKLVEHVSDAIIGLDADGRIDSWNPAAEEMYGWTREAVIGQKFADVVGADSRLGLESAKHLETVHRRSDGTLLEVRISVALVLDPDQEVTGAVAVCADITERRRSEAARRALEERYTAVVASLEEGIVVSDDQGVITAANRAAESILSRRIMVGERLEAVFGDDLHARHPDGFLIADDEHPTVRTLRTGESFTNVLIGIELAGHEQRWLSLNSRPLRHDDLLPYGMVCSFSDVTERRRTERQLNYQATHDALTGLANRPVFIENLRQTLEHARRGGSRVGVLFIDLDRFKVVNDSQGHLVGDEVLTSVARRLQQTTRSVDTVARLSGDEFVVLCPDLADIESARRRACEIADVIAQPIPVSSGRDVVITASVGVSCVESGLGDPEAMLRDADVAMYTAKERGRARVELLDDTLRERAQRRTDIERDLRMALDNDELAVYYQPIVDYGADREHRSRGARPVAAPERPDHPGRVHPDRRGVGTHPAARHLGAEQGVRRGRALEGDGPGRREPAHQREPVRSPARRSRRGRERRRRAHALWPRAGRALARDHREHPDGRRRRCGPHAERDPRARRAPRHRRLRHRLLVAGLPQAVPGRHPQDRPLVRRRARPRRGERGHRARGRRPDPVAAPLRHRGGCRDHRPADRAAPARMRHLPGLLLLEAAAGGRGLLRHRRPGRRRAEPRGLAGRPAPVRPAPPCARPARCV